jgi:hypothetical protein
MVSNLLVSLSLSPYPSPFSKVPIVRDCLSLNTFHFACDNAQDNEMEKNTFSVGRKRECRARMQFLLALFPVFVCSSFALQKHLDRHTFCHGIFSIVFREALCCNNDKTTFYSSLHGNF